MLLYSQYPIRFLLSFAEGKIEGKTEGKIESKAEMIVLMGQDLGWDDQQIINYLMKQLSIPLDKAQALFTEMQSRA